MRNLRDYIEPISGSEYTFKGENVNFVTIADDDLFHVGFKQPYGMVMVTPPALTNLRSENLLDVICNYYSSHEKEIRESFDRLTDLETNWDIESNFDPDDFER